jgi:hypothetical protein
MPDQIIDAMMARAVQADVARAHSLFAWITWGLSRIPCCSGCQRQHAGSEQFCSRAAIH